MPSSVAIEDERARARGVVDWSIALGLAAALELQLALRDDGAPWVNALAALALTLPLRWRRTAPLAVVLAYAGTAVAQELAGGGLFDGVPAPLPAILAGIVAFYSLGAYASSDRMALVAAVAGLTGIWASVLVSADADAQSFALPALLIVAGPWLAGRAQSARAQREAALRELTSQFQREQDQRERLAASDERARIARELHDVVAHSVGVMVVQAQGARNVLDRDPERAREALRSIEDTGRGALAEVRRALGVLREPGGGAAREPQPGVDDVGALVEQARATGLDVALTVEGASRPLPAGIGLSAYRIVQEALTNTIKHAGAAHVTIAIRYGARELALEIADDGARRNGAGDGSGHGLVGMRERVALYGGDLSAGPRGAGGFAVRARIPIEA